jgi:RNA polymerase sigma-70 factor (ECF subfamily)
MNRRSNGPADIEKILLESRERLFAFIVALVRNLNDAEDIFQEVALVVLEKARAGEEVRNFGAWSREIARRTVLDHWKKRKRSKLIFSDDAIAALQETFAGHDGEAYTDRLEKLHRCVEALPAHLKSLVNLFYGERCSLTAIGKRVGKSMTAVQVALSRTRVRLLKCMKLAEPAGEMERV